MKWAAGVLSLSMALAGCSEPTEQVQTLDERPSILVRGAPASARLMIDGLDFGAVTTSGGAAQAIRIQPGTHRVEVLDMGRVLLRERLFVSGGTIKTLSLPGTAP